MAACAEHLSRNCAVGRDELSSRSALVPPQGMAHGGGCRRVPKMVPYTSHTGACCVSMNDWSVTTLVSTDLQPVFLTTVFNRSGQMDLSDSPPTTIPGSGS